MATGYTRQSSGLIATGNTVFASHFNNEFNAIENAFNATTGHNHDGTAGGGAPIDLTTATTGTLPLTRGGTGAATAAAARTALGLVIGTDVLAVDAGLVSIAGLTTAANQMIYTTALDTYAVTSLTAFARTLLDDGDAATMRSTLGLVIGTNVQAYDAALASIAGLATSADQMIYLTNTDTYATASLTSFGRSLLDDANAAAARSTLGLGTAATGNIGSDVQAYDVGLASIAGLTTAADRMIYTTALDTYAVATLTSFARTLLDDSSASAARSTLGLGGWATKASAVVARTTGYTVTTADDGKLIECDATSAAFTVTLPAAATAGAGFFVAIKKTDASANAVTIDGNGAETIDGSAGQTLESQNDSKILYCDGTEWWVVGEKDVAAAASAFPSGTAMLFQQTAAPTGWTKQVTHDNKALRIVSGTVTTGGASSFTSVFNSGLTTGSHALTTTEIPSHTHGAGSLVTASAGNHAHTQSFALGDSGGGFVNVASAFASVASGDLVTGYAMATTGAHTHGISGSTAANGSGGGHSHDLSLDLQYVDVIIATKD